MHRHTLRSAPLPYTPGLYGGSRRKPKERNYRYRPRHFPRKAGRCVFLFLFSLLGIAFFLSFHSPFMEQSTPLLPSASPQASFSPPPTPSPSLMPSPTPVPSPLLVNAAHPLPEGYVPENLVELASAYPDGLMTYASAGILGCREAADALTAMISAAHADGLMVWQVSDGYRSIQTQQRIWDETYQKYRTVNGLSEEKAEEATRRRVAVPGASEHHTGLAFDLTVPGESFRKTPQSVWLAENCWDYGFIIRYQEEKERLTGIAAEPWHIRYVGLPHSLRMKEKGLCLEEYIATLPAS